MRAVPQQTIVREVGFEGIALHGGNTVSVRLRPAAENTGIVFRRTDKKTDIRADCKAVCDTHLATTLGGGDGGATVGTVEHLLSALAAFSLDNLLIELNGDELPILDGSAASWCALLGACGVRPQKAARRHIRVRREVSVNGGAQRASWRPAADDASCYEVTINYPHAIVTRGGASCSFALTADDYERRIGRARTFCYINDVETMHRHNRAQGGSLQNAVVYDDNGVINAEGLRYPDEFVRHKMLDVIGDCYINGHLVLGDYQGESPGHSLNNKLMRALAADKTAWEWTEKTLS